MFSLSNRKECILVFSLMERQQLCQFYLDEGGGGGKNNKVDSKFIEVLACDQPGGLW